MSKTQARTYDIYLQASHGFDRDFERPLPKSQQPQTPDELTIILCHGKRRCDMENVDVCCLESIQ